MDGSQPTEESRITTYTVMKLHKPIWLVCLQNRWNAWRKAKREKEVEKIEKHMSEQLNQMFDSRNVTVKKYGSFEEMKSNINGKTLPKKNEQNN